MSKQPGEDLQARVFRAASVVLERARRVALVEVLIEMQLLQRRDVEEFYRRHIPFLEKVIHANLTRIARIQTALRRFALRQGLVRQVAEPKRHRRYTKYGHSFAEEEYRASYVHPNNARPEKQPRASSAPLALAPPPG